MRLLASVLVLGLAACAAPERVALLPAEPERPYREIGEVQAEGRIGAPPADARQALQREAAALGADAVIEVVEERTYRPPPSPRTAEDRADLGDPLPDLLEVFRPGYFGYAGNGAATVGGYVWRASGVAIELEGQR